MADEQKAAFPDVTIPGEIYAFLMGEGPLEGVWFGEMNEGFNGAFPFWWRALLRSAAGWLESATPNKDNRNE